MTKMTNAIALNTAIKVLGADAQYTEVVEKLQKMLEQTEKKNSAERKPTATQKANEDLKTAILNFMLYGEKYTVSDILSNCSAVEGLSNQKVSALMRQLYLETKVEREEIKRKAYFSLRVGA